VTAIALVPFGPEHLEALAPMLEDPDVRRHTFVPDPPQAGFARRWLDRYEEGRRNGTREGFAVVDTDGTMLGLALAPRIEREARTVELGYLVAPKARGRGIATEALRLLTDWAFQELDAERIELKIAAENPASKRVAERCGYLREGVLRSTYFKNGVRQDTEIWSRLPSDPSKRWRAGGRSLRRAEDRSSRSGRRSRPAGLSDPRSDRTRPSRPL
jgi:RimJ/RimL family protein N-acetyltransferase